jgi:hypothetical protein
MNCDMCLGVGFYAGFDSERNRRPARPQPRSDRFTHATEYNFVRSMWAPHVRVQVRVGSAIVGIVTASGYGTPGLPAEVFLAARRFAGWM